MHDCSVGQSAYIGFIREFVEKITFFENVNEQNVQIVPFDGNVKSFVKHIVANKVNDVKVLCLKCINLEKPFLNPANSNITLETESFDYR